MTPSCGDTGADVRRIALGCAQFGSSYGIANRDGQLTPDEGARVLAFAAAAGMDTLDTAFAYGSSEERLGTIGIAGWRVVTKLPPMPDGAAVRDWVGACIDGSLARLRVPRLGGVLVHRSADLAGEPGDAIRGALVEARDAGRVGKIGVSIYSPDELDALPPDLPLDLVQAPFNVLDRRLEESGWLERLKGRGTEVHVRSAFLQGLLLMPPERRPTSFRRWQSVWDVWDEWLLSTATSPLDACLGFVLSRSGIDRVVVGVDSVAQLAEIVSAARLAPPAVVPVGTADVELIEPFRWTDA